MRFRALDACRGLCAVMVVLFHTDALTHWYGWPAVRNGYVAVDFFFVLSGFVIASAYQAKLATVPALARYLVRRLGRLYPLHFAVLIVYLAIELFRLRWLHAADAFTGNTSLRAFGEQLVLVQGFTADHESWNYPAWSISVELWINVAFGSAALLLGRRLIPAVVLGTLALGTFLATADGQQLILADALRDALEAAFAFGMGVLAHALFAHVRLRTWKPPASAELLVVPVMAASFGYADALPALALALGFAGVVFVLAFETGVLSRLLLRPPCTALGTISYSVYLTHSLYLLAMMEAVYAIAGRLGLPASVSVNGDDLLVLGGPWATDGAALLALAATLGGSVLTYRYVEDPARRFFNRLSDSVRRVGPMRSDLVRPAPVQPHR